MGHRSLRVRLAGSGAGVACLLMAGAGPLPAASSDDHAWFIVRTAPPGSRIELRHWALEMSGPHFATGMTLSVGEPDGVEAMAAWNNQLWLVFAPTPEEAARRETFTVQVYLNPALDVWYYAPPDRLLAIPSLPGTGKLAGFTATADGPVALIAGAGPAGPDTAGGDKTEAGLTLLRLEGQLWRGVALPEGIETGGPWRLASAGTDGRQLILLGTPAGPGDPVPQYRRLGTGTWSRSEVDLGPQRLRSVTRVGPNAALVTEDAGGDHAAVAYLRPSLLLPLAAFPAPKGRWTVVGARDGPRLLEQGLKGEVAITRIDETSGRLGPRQVMSPQPLMAGRVLHRPLLLALGIMAVVVIVLFRPGSSPVQLPADLVVLPPLSRLLAVVVDLAVSGAVVLVVFRCSPSELMWWPLWTVGLPASGPFLAMIGLTVAHETISELVFARTLGKKLVNAFVVAGDGARPAARAIIVRNALKTIVLLIPVLAVFALFSPHLQGLGDQVARTVVVRRRPDDPEAKSKDR